MLIKSGEDEIAKKMLLQYRWFCVDPLMQFEWYSLRASAGIINGTPREAYEILCSVDKNSLFEKEKVSLAIAKAGYLVQLGNYNGATALISGLKNVDGDLFLQQANIIAICQEVRGELSASSDTLISALNSTENPKSKSLPFIFNNLGRIRKFEGNITDAFHYYEKAANAAVVNGEKHLIHTSYQNLILSYELEKNYEKAKMWIADYRCQIDTSNVNDLHEFINFNLDYYRQKGDNEKILSTIETGRSVLYPKLTDKKKILYDIRELRIRWNSHFLKPSFLIHIEKQLDKYLILDLSDRYFSLKEINGILLRLKSMDELGPFLSFHEIVSHHLHEMESEIEKYLLTLPEYCVNDKCTWLLELASIRKIDGDQYDYQKVLQRLTDLKNTRLKSGNYLECLMVGLNICDEAMYQKKKDLVWQSTQQSIKELERFKGHAIEAQCFIRIAYYANYVGQQKCAEDFFQRFLKTGISIDHFADWIQAYYTDLLFNLNP
jgi:tetratricopeptide (TPR) repeat protein